MVAPTHDLRALLEGYREALEELDTLTRRFSVKARQIERLLDDEIDQPGFTDEADGSPASSGPIEISCLGAFALRSAGRHLPLQADGRAAALLKVLATRGRQSVGRDALIATLWPDADPRHGANRLHGIVFSLRRLTGSPEIVIVEQGQYRLGDHVEVDALRFEEFVRRAERLARAADPEAASAALEEAVQLYGGDYLEQDDEEWATIHRQYLRDLYLTAIVKLAELSLGRGDFEAAIRHALDALRYDSCSEEAYRLLMLAHHRIGNRARARRWYERCEEMLERELQIQPSARTRQLRDLILQAGADVGEAPGGADEIGDAPERR